MSATNLSGTILVRENTLLPVGLAIESEVFLPGWRVVKNLDGSTMARTIEGANWNFFYLAGEVRVTVLGPDRSGTLRRAVKRLLPTQEEHFNSLEITRVVSKRFLGIPVLNVVAHPRQIQQSICLVPAAPETGPGSGRERRGVETITNRHTALISSS
jgi:hypothetical protein